jgi:hypothetical protein
LRRQIRLITLVIVLLLPSALLSQKSSHSSTRSSSTKSSSSKPKTSTKEKTVHVKEYERKDGTIVQAHDRSAPGTKSTATVKAKSVSPSATPGSSTVAARDANGKIARSAAAKDAFMKQTGYPKGRPGYVVDHKIPLECGGADTPSNMQWQTVQEAKVKDRTERNCRR